MTLKLRIEVRVWDGLLRYSLTMPITKRKSCISTGKCITLVARGELLIVILVSVALGCIPAIWTFERYSSVDTGM